MSKAVQVWKDGGEWWEIREDDGTFSATVATRNEAIEYEASEFILTDEPRFLVRDESGRGGAAETLYTSFTESERSYSEETYDIDGNPEDNQTFGEWLDASYAGDEFNNSDSRFTVIRIN